MLTDEGRRRLRDATSTHLRGIAVYLASQLGEDEAELIADGFRRVSVR
jgi:hypothetical protein